MNLLANYTMGAAHIANVNVLSRLQKSQICLQT